MNSRMYAAAVLAGLALLTITIVLVFQFGRHDPSPPSLLETPNPAIPGKILYVNERQCVVVAEASGASSEEVYCFGNDKYFSNLYWVDGDTFAYGMRTGPGPNSMEVVEVDITTGEASEPRTVTVPNDVGRPGSISPDGEEAMADEGGTIVLVKEGVRTEIADFDVPEYHWPQPVLWSPDSEWLLLQYYPPRGGSQELWVISRDGQTRGTLGTDVRGFSYAWWIEGVGSWPELPE